tara:strand:- start:1124 stop:2770 length:1647 start_codon:yes stop_codon:yes gene_type:complete
MPGGAIQLSKKGKQDARLSKNPELSFFKSVFKRYTNFHTESISIEPINNLVVLKQSQDVKIEFKINNNDTDLISKMYFIFDLPDIYSFVFDGGLSGDQRKRLEFEWISRIGEYVIKECQLRIGNNLIDTLYGEWLHIWAELTLPESKKNGYYEMIGNVSNMYCPRNQSGTYPGSVDIDTGSDKFYIPSIKSRQIIVPLPFWFTYSLGQALPTHMLEYEEINIQITLRPLDQLYTVLNHNTSVRTPPNTDTKIGHFINRKTDMDGTPSTISTELSINPRLELGGIFLDKEEKMIMKNLRKKEYLILQTNKKEYTVEIPDETNIFNHSIGLNFEYPTTKLVFMARRIDYETNYLQFHNYTNYVWDSSNNTTFNPDTGHNNGTDSNPFNAGNEQITTTSINSLKYSDLILSAEFYFKTMKRFQIQNINSFNLINNYQHSIRIPQDGIYAYSFEDVDLYNKYQPTGACDMSMINNSDQSTTIKQQNRIDFRFAPKNKINSFDYSYRVFIFSMNYNIIKFGGGISNLVYTDNSFTEDTKSRSLVNVRYLIDKM